MIAAMLLLTSCSASQTTSVQPVSSTSPRPSVDDSAFRQAVNQAMIAASAAQSAKSPASWEKVASLWSQGIASMKGVPKASPNYGSSLSKVKEYQEYFQYAQRKSVDVPQILVQVKELLKQGLTLRSSPDCTDKMRKLQPQAKELRAKIELMSPDSAVRVHLGATVIDLNLCVSCSDALAHEACIRVANGIKDAEQAVN